MRRSFLWQKPFSTVPAYRILPSTSTPSAALVCRAEYHKALKAYFEPKKEELCETCQTRLEKNPMRILDCKSPICAGIAKDAPVILDYLCDDCRTHFEKLQEYLKALHIDYSINPKIVRGLDYYTKTVFEFITTDIGAQGTVCGGGRYDGLIEQMGGKPTPAMGFAMGLERLHHDNGTAGLCL